MAQLFYKDERDVDFLKACELIRSEKGSNLSVQSIASQAILKPAKSFYLHPREYVNVIRSKQLPKSEAKKNLHLEIIGRYNQIKTENPNLKTHQIAKMIENQEAPRFYISERRAADLYYSLIKHTHV